MAQTKRVKPIVPMAQIRTIEQANKALFKIAQLRLEIKQLNTETEKEINFLKENLIRKVEPYQEQIQEIENGLFTFAEFNKNLLFQQKKSVELDFGLLGYRQSTKISIKKQTLEKLKEKGLFNAIIVKESVNKEILKDFDNELLKEVLAKRIIEDKFWYEIKEDVVKENLQNQVKQVKRRA